MEERCLLGQGPFCLLPGIFLPQLLPLFYAWTGGCQQPISTCRNPWDTGTQVQTSALLGAVGLLEKSHFVVCEGPDQMTLKSFPSPCNLRMQKF